MAQSYTSGQRKPMTRRSSPFSDILPPRRDSHVFVAAARHSRVVRTLKIGIPAFAVALIAVFAGLTVFARPDLPDVAIDLTKTAVKDGKLVMATPRMNGFTKDNKPYSMEAERAVQEVGNTAEIMLEKIAAKVPFTGDEMAVIAAEAALYNNEKQTLSISKPFKVTTTDGLDAAMQSAFVDIDTGTLSTDRPVDIDYKGAHITAQSMQVLERGKVLVFENKVRLNIDPGTVKTVQAGSDPAASEGN